MTMANSGYQYGDLIRVHGNFVNVSNSPTDPDSVFFRLVVGSVDLQYTYPTTNAITKADVGSYYYEMTVESPGEHYFYWRSYGAVAAGEYGGFMVHSPIPPY